MLFEEVCNVNGILWDTFAMLRSSFSEGRLAGRSRKEEKASIAFVRTNAA